MNRAAWAGMALALVVLCPPVLALDAEEAAFLDIINQYRLANGVPPLALSPTLTQASELHSQDMADHDYFSHYSLDGRSPYDRMVQAGYNYATWMGENIAAGFVTAAQVFQGWKNSPGHDANMLRPNFVVIGIGRAYNASSHYGWYWTTDFGGYDDSGAPPAPIVTSPTHPSRDLWYANHSPVFEWEGVPDAEGYSFLIDHSPYTTPDSSIDSNTTSATYSNLQDGTWYFHVRAKTPTGWGQASHYRINVDCTPPEPPAIASSTHPDQDAQYPNDDPSFSWSPLPDTSGISGYSYLLDREALTTPDEVLDTYSTYKSYHDLQEGLWYFHVRCVDRAGNWGPASHFRIAVRFLPSADFEAAPRNGYEPLSVAFTDLSLSRTGITNWSWDFGDGCTSRENNPVHLYLREGVYSVSLEVWESDGDHDRISKTDYIRVATPAPDDFLVASVAKDWEPIIGSSLFGAFALEDSYVSPDQPAVNHGHEPLLLCDSQGSSIYLAMDLSAIPTGATILDAGLSLYFQSGIGLVDPHVRVSYIEDDSWTEAEICWDNAPLHPDMDCESKEFLAFPGMYARFNVSWAVRTALPRRRISLRISVCSGNGTLLFASGESDQIEARPLIVVRYTTGDLHRVSFSSVGPGGVVRNLGRVSIGGIICSLPSNASVIAGSYPLAYLPGWDFEMWQAEGALSVSNPFANATILTVWGPGVVVAKGNSTKATYAYDDGTCEFALGASRGQLLAVEFSPPITGRLAGIRLFFEDISDAGNNNALVRILRRDGNDLVPPIPIDPKNEGWLVIELDDPVDLAGDFLVALQHIEDGWPRIGVDTSSSAASLLRQGAGWQDYDSNLMIRCELDHLPSLKLAARLSLEFAPPTPRAGEVVTVSGRLEPETPQAYVTITLEPPGRTRINHTIHLTSLGEFSFDYVPPWAGLWHVRAFWEGDSNSSPANETIQIPVERGSVHITCIVEPDLSNYGEPIRVSGEVGPVAVPFAVEQRVSGGPWLSLAQPDCPSELAYELWFVPPEAGNYEFRASWPGNEDFLGFETPPARLQVLKANSSITCMLDATSTAYGSQVQIFGTISPGCSASVKIRYIQGAEWHDIGIAAADQDGSFRYTWTVDAVGSLFVASLWEGDHNHNGAMSELIYLSSSRARATLYCLVEPSVVAINESITIQGKIHPPHETAIEIGIESPKGSIDRAQAYPGPSGEFAVRFTPQKAGAWKVIAESHGSPCFEPSRYTAEFSVERTRVDLECCVSPSALAFGDRVQIAGSCSSAGGQILLQYAYAGGDWTDLDWVDCSPDRGYECSWLPPHAGHYRFRAVRMGDERFQGSESQTVEAYVSKGASSISLTFDGAPVVYGSCVTISGEIWPPLATQVVLERFDSGGWNQVTIVPSAPDGHYGYSMQVDFVGEASIRSSWRGNDDWLGASSEVLTIKSEQADISLSCHAQPPYVEPDQPVAIHGEVRPPMSIPIVVDAISSEGSEFRYHVISDPAGRYAINVTLSKAGAWHVVAACNGTEVYRGYVTPGTWILVVEDVAEALPACLLLLLGAFLAVRAFGMCPSQVPSLRILLFSPNAHSLSEL